MTHRTTHPAGSVFDFGPLADRYDRWYATGAGRAHDRVQKADVRRLLPRASSGERLLDVGCGTGHWSAFFAEMGYRVTGVDVAPEMVEAARTAAPECSFREADAHDLPFDEASFDVVASMATVEFLTDPAAALREMARCTGPGGKLLIGTLNRLAGLNRRRLAEGREPYSSARLFAPSELRDLLDPLGRVRMLASSPRRPKRRPSLRWRSTGRTGIGSRPLAGPFVVAEVRL